MSLDLVLKNALIDESRFNNQTVNIGIDGGVIAAIETDIQLVTSENTEIIELDHHLVTPGLIETHIHLDKSRLLDRCSPPPPNQADMMTRIIAVKPDFTSVSVFNCNAWLTGSRLRWRDG